MDKQTAIILTRQIEADDPSINVISQRLEGGLCQLVIEDSRTGYTAVLRSPEDWEDRKRAAACPVVED